MKIKDIRAKIKDKEPYMSLENMHINTQQNQHLYFIEHRTRHLDPHTTIWFIVQHTLVYTNLYSSAVLFVVSRSINKVFLLITDVPGRVDIQNGTFCLEYSEFLSGALLA